MRCMDPRKDANDLVRARRAVPVQGIYELGCGAGG